MIIICKNISFLSFLANNNIMLNGITVPNEAKGDSNTKHLPNCSYCMEHPGDDCKWADMLSTEGTFPWLYPIFN